MTPHVCIVTSAHPIDDARVYSKFACSFLASGFRVSWIGPETTAYSEEGWRDPRIDYHMLPAIGGQLDRLMAARRLAGPIRRIVDVDWIYCPDPDAADIAARVKPKSVRLIFDIHEVYHGPMLDRWLRGRELRVVRETVRRRIARTSARADIAVAVSAAVLQPYSPRDKGVIIRNCAPLSFAELRSVGSSARQPETFRVMHGLVSEINGTRGLVETARHLKQMGTSARIQMFAGRSPWSGLTKEVASRIEAEELAANLHLLPRVRHDEIPRVLNSCQLGVIAYGRSLGTDSLPNRLFEYMAAGVAVLVPEYAVEIRRIVEAERIGIMADFEDPKAVAEAIAWFVANPGECELMGIRAREAFLSRHNWEGEFGALLSAMAS